MPRIRLLEAKVTTVVTGYLNGVSMDVLAKTHGVSEGTIRNLLIRQGVELRKRGRPVTKEVTNVNEQAL